MIEAEEISTAFFQGRLDSLKNRPCPKCDGRLYYSIYQGDVTANATIGTRDKIGFSLYCIGACNVMLDHCDGYLPSWAENIADWENFNETLYDNDWREKYPNKKSGTKWEIKEMQE